MSCCSSRPRDGRRAGRAPPAAQASGPEQITVDLLPVLGDGDAALPNTGGGDMLARGGPAGSWHELSSPPPLLKLGQRRDWPAAVTALGLLPPSGGGGGGGGGVGVKSLEQACAEQAWPANLAFCDHAGWGEPSTIGRVSVRRKPCSVSRAILPATAAAAAAAAAAEVTNGNLRANAFSPAHISREWVCRMSLTCWGGRRRRVAMAGRPGRGPPAEGAEAGGNRVPLASPHPRALPPALHSSLR